MFTTMPEDEKQKVIAFLSGDFVVTLFFTLGIWNDLAHFGVKVLATVILGVAGGIAGIAGKDAYNRVKRWWKQRKSKP